MSGDRIKIRELAVEWGAEIGVPSEDLARALTEAAIAGEFDHLPPANRASLFDDRRLIHIPIRSGTPAYPERLILFSIRGMGYIHREAVGAFASADGRGYPFPQRWTSNRHKWSFEKLSAFVAGLGAVTKKEALQRVKAEVGGDYEKTPFEDAWRARPNKSLGGRPRKNPS